MIGFATAGLVKTSVIRFAVMEGERETARKQILVYPNHRCAKQRAEFVHESRRNFLSFEAPCPSQESFSRAEKSESSAIEASL
jgi:hypothetical protein